MFLKGPELSRKNQRIILNFLDCFEFKRSNTWIPYSFYSKSYYERGFLALKRKIPFMDSRKSIKWLFMVSALFQPTRRLPNVLSQLLSSIKKMRNSLQSGLRSFCKFIVAVLPRECNCLNGEEYFERYFRNPQMLNYYKNQGIDLTYYLSICCFIQEKCWNCKDGRKFIDII